MTWLEENYRGNLTWLSARTILLARHGSHAYGTNIATSDLDVKGVAIPPREYFHGYLHRFEQAEGKDPEHGMHLVRLMRMCREILETGKVIVKRPDAEELLAIRNGAWFYDRLVEWAEREDAALEEVVKTSSLPHGPDRAMLDRLCQTIVEKGL